MKVFIVAGQTSGFGGVESVVKRLYQLLSKDEDIECKLLICGKPKNHNSLNWLEDINYTNVAKRTSFRLLVKLFSKQYIANVIKNEHPDFIIGYDAFAIEIARKAIDVSKANTKLISWPHFSFNTFSDKNKQRFLMADYHFAICDEIKEQISQHNINKSNIFTIYNPVSRSETNIPRPIDVTKFLYVGRVQYADQKNLQELFYALSMVEGNFILDIVGGVNNEEQKKLDTLAEKLNIQDKIHYHGWQSSPWEYVAKNIKQTTALVMTSTFEGFSMVLIEAIAHGIYCISSNCETGPEDVIQENVNGNLYSAGAPKELAKTLQEIVNKKVLSNHQVIQNSISHLYDDQYIKNVKNVLMMVE